MAVVRACQLQGVSQSRAGRWESEGAAARGPGPAAPRRAPPRRPAAPPRPRRPAPPPAPPRALPPLASPPPSRHHVPAPRRPALRPLTRAVSGWRRGSGPPSWQEGKRRRLLSGAAGPERPVPLPPTQPHPRSRARARRHRPQHGKVRAGRAPALRRPAPRPGQPLPGLAPAFPGLGSSPAPGLPDTAGPDVGSPSQSPHAPPELGALCRRRALGPGALRCESV